MKKNSKKSILLLSIGGGLFICLISIYLSRNMLLQSITNKRTTHIEQTYGLQIHYQNLQMKGCSEITLQGLSIVPDQRDTLLTLQSVNVRLNFWKLLKGNIEVRNVHMNGLAIAFIKRDSAANYDFLFSGHHPEATTEPVIETNYAHRINRILNLIYGFFPENGHGVEAIRKALEGKITLFSGHSGVGKSTLINAILPGIETKTGEISSYHNKGMHTTTFSEMFPVDGDGYIIDTPGIKGFGTFDMEEEEIGHYFPEIFKVSAECKYGNCTHRHEPGCAVRKAVEEHLISESRYTSYLNMLEDKKEGKYRAAY